MSRPEWSTMLATATRYRKAAIRHRAKADEWDDKAAQLEEDVAEIRARLRDVTPGRHAGVP